MVEIEYEGRDLENEVSLKLEESNGQRIDFISDWIWILYPKANVPSQIRSPTKISFPAL